MPMDQLLKRSHPKDMWKARLCSFATTSTTLCGRREVGQAPTIQLPMLLLIHHSDPSNGLEEYFNRIPLLQPAQVTTQSFATAMTIILSITADHLQKQMGIR